MTASDLSDAAQVKKQSADQAAALFRSGKFEESIEHYSKAILADPTSAMLYSNRSAAHCSYGSYHFALEDAEKAIALNPSWAKAYARKATALSFLGRREESIEIYNEGLKVYPGCEFCKRGYGVFCSLKQNFEIQSCWSSVLCF